MLDVEYLSSIFWRTSKQYKIIEIIALEWPPELYGKIPIAKDITHIGQKPWKITEAHITSVLYYTGGEGTQIKYVLVCPFVSYTFLYSGLLA